MTLKFTDDDKIQGETALVNCPNEIDVLSWSWGMSQAGSTHQSTGSGSGKVDVRDLSFTKYVDKTSPTLMQFCCNGQHLKEALLTIRKAGGKKPVDYVRIFMKDIIVANVSHGASGGQDRLTEEVTLNFGKVKYEYTLQKPDGTPASPIPTEWDIAGNVPTYGASKFK